MDTHLNQPINQIGIDGFIYLCKGINIRRIIDNFTLVLESVGLLVGVIVEVAESYENVLLDTFLAILSTITDNFLDLSSLVLSTISITSDVVDFSTISSTTLSDAA